MKIKIKNYFIDFKMNYSLFYDLSFFSFYLSSKLMSLYAF